VAATLAGTAVDATGAVLPYVRLTLKGPVSRVEQTRPDGRFVFSGLPPGEYELVAELDGFAPLHRSLRLRPDGIPDLELVLQLVLREMSVVTADRTGERQANVTPLAVSTLSGVNLNRSEAHTLADLGGTAPGFTFSQNTGFAQVTIRGIGTNVVFAGSDPSSAVYVDGVYVARPAAILPDFLDLERIEVLRGPQGTLYGRNAAGGALNLVTRPPASVFEASTRLVAGGLGMVRSDARVSGPIVANRILGTLAILRGVRRGAVRDLDHPDHPLGGEDATSAAAKLQWLFDAGDLLLSADLTHQDPAPLVYAKVLAVKPGFEVRNPPDLHEVRTSTLARSRKLQHAASARLTVRLAPTVVLTSLTAFRKLDYDLVVDADITELNLTESHVHEIHHQWSQEVTFSGQDARLSWVSGMFLFDDVDRQPTRVPFPAAGRENQLDPHVSSHSGAVFGQATLRLAPRLSGTAGLRYTREHKSIDNAGRFVTLTQPTQLVAGTAYAYHDEISAHAWTPKVGLEAQISPGGLAYVSATRGFKTGGFNLTSGVAGRGFSPEWVWSYELGLKKTLGLDRAQVNVAAFHADYSDLQVQTAILPGVIDISNAAEGTIRGVEVEGSIQVSRGLRAGGHAAWLDARYDRHTAVGVGGVTGDVAGRRLSNAPEWSGRVWVEWRGGLRRTGTALLRADARWQSTVFFTPFNDAIQRQTPYALLDLSAEFGPRRGIWSVGAFARNVTGEDYITGSFSSPPPAIGGRPGDPRQIGVQLTLHR
jgi:iron complex outermembrane receptor protein